jgi:hypothetical protein
MSTNGATMLTTWDMLIGAEVQIRAARTISADDRRKITSQMPDPSVLEDGASIVQARGDLEVLKVREATQAEVVARLNDQWGDLTARLASAVQRHDSIVRSLRDGDLHPNGRSATVETVVEESLALVGPPVEASATVPVR